MINCWHIYIMLTELAVTLLIMLDAAELLAELAVEEVALEVELVVCAELVAFAMVLVARDCVVLDLAAWAACLVVVDAACAAAYIRTIRVLSCQPCNHSPPDRGSYVPTWKQQQRQRSNSQLPAYCSAVGDCTRSNSHRNACPQHHRSQTSPQ